MMVVSIKVVNIKSMLILITVYWTFEINAGTEVGRGNNSGKN